MPETIEFIPNSGGVIVSRSMLNGVPLKWMLREQPVDPADNGWRFMSPTDDEAYLADSRNLAITTFNSVANIVPAILSIYNFPIGSDLVLVRDEAAHRIRIIDNLTGQDVA